MARRMVGNQTEARNQSTAPAARSATMNCTRSSRPKVALENAATPRAVRGCQANGRGRSLDFGSGMSDGLDSSCDIRQGSFRLGLLALVERRHDDQVERVANLHHVVDRHLHEVGARHGELHVAEKCYRGGVDSRILHLELYFAFTEDGRLVGGDQAHAFGEDAHARRPAIEDAEFESSDWELRHAHEVDHTDEEKIPRGLLANLLADERALEVG